MIKKEKSAGLISKKIRHAVGRAIGDYGLIEAGDIIAVGLSGGKDSGLLIHFLADLRRRAPLRFSLGVFHLGGGEESLRPWLETLKLDFIHFEPAPRPAELVAYVPGGPSPCFVCARARRNRLFELSRSFGVTSLALGHHLDDAIETLLLNIFYSGRLEALAARQALFEGRLKLIRPLILAPEDLVSQVVSALDLPLWSAECPADGHTRRQQMKDIVSALRQGHPKVGGNLVAVSARTAWGRSL